MTYIAKFAHPDHPDMFAGVVLASRPTNCALPILSVHARYPRIIHSEVMTHRKFSRNARSSRAVPVKTMLNEIRNNPFVPWHWGANQKGMQAGEDCNELVEFTRIVRVADGFTIAPGKWSREAGWLHQRDHAAEMAEAYMNAGYHKQIPNRLLEPFAWMDTLITSTSWANFKHLRVHKDAEPHFQDLAALVEQALDHVKVFDLYQPLDTGQWHLPYITPDDYRIVLDYLRNGVKINPTPERQVEVLKKISAARCARISYTPFDGDGSFEREMERYQILISSDRLHASPTEHQATPDEGITNGKSVNWLYPDLAGNLGSGWIQFRKTLPGEYVAD
ncbi:hypothetical protein NKH72_21960 [Mesorhizobium sp. M0955]|uniref:hypothetical protein n=1 Tax=Mesorhizobium sp. M0955 TaxID=2957033 RepID=UPI0033369D7A